jgi:hypothetical protein
LVARTFWIFIKKRKKYLRNIIDMSGIR